MTEARSSNRVFVEACCQQVNRYLGVFGSPASGSTLESPRATAEDRATDRLHRLLTLIQECVWLSVGRTAHGTALTCLVSMMFTCNTPHNRTLWQALSWGRHPQ